MHYITGASAPRPAMVEAIRRIRARGLRAGALTNNWVTEASRAPHPVRAHFEDCHSVEAVIDRYEEEIALLVGARPQ